MISRFKAVIVDDESLPIDIIEAYLKDFPSIEIAGKYTKSKQAIDKIIEIKPDLLFLDIHLPVINGFQLIEAIIAQHNPYIIFTTAFDQYAIKAFEVNAIGYLLKPFDKANFGMAVNKFMEYAKLAGTQDIYNGIIKMLDDKHKTAANMERILIREHKKIFYVPVSEIQHFEAQGDYIKVVTGKKNYLVNDSLTSLELRLSPDDFIRIHRSVIINAKHVREFIPYFNNEYHIVMNNGELLKMSRHYRENLVRVFTELR